MRPLLTLCAAALVAGCAAHAEPMPTPAVAHVRWDAQLRPIVEADGAACDPLDELIVYDDSFEWNGRIYGAGNQLCIRDPGRRAQAPLGELRHQSGASWAARALFVRAAAQGGGFGACAPRFGAYDSRRLTACERQSPALALDAPSVAYPID